MKKLTKKIAEEFIKDKKKFTILVLIILLVSQMMQLKF